MNSALLVYVSYDMWLVYTSLMYPTIYGLGPISNFADSGIESVRSQQMPRGAYWALGGFG